MKTLALEQTDQRITDVLKHQRREDPILLTQGADALGLLLPLPEGTKDWDVDGAYWLEESMGHVLVIIQAKHGRPTGSVDGPGRPVFGSCKGMMTVTSEDDEHLKDFAEYMK